MANNVFYIPVACPVNFIALDKNVLPQYQSRFIDDYWFADRLNRWQGGATYLQPWSSFDSIPLQFVTNQGQAQIDIVDCKRQVVGNFLTTQKQQNPYDPGTFIYEANVTLTGLSGTYFLHMFTPLQHWYSEPLDIQPQHDPSLLIEFKHKKYHAGVIFETGYVGKIRIAAMLKMKPPVTKDTVFEDQILDLQMVNSKKFRLWELIIGVPTHNPIGLPDWMIDRLTDILGCSEVKLDGRQFTRNEGFKWDEVDDTYNGALHGYKGELRETVNKNSKTFTPDGLQSQRTAIILNVSSKGFADTSTAASSGLVTFENVE